MIERRALEDWTPPLPHTHTLERVATQCLTLPVWVWVLAQRKFESVRAYQKASSWKLKHHLMQHLAIDILNFGPPRLYWCMRFEAMNQVRNPMPLCMPARPGSAQLGLARA